MAAWRRGTGTRSQACCCRSSRATSRKSKPNFQVPHVAVPLHGCRGSVFGRKSVQTKVDQILVRAHALMIRARRRQEVTHVSVLCPQQDVQRFSDNDKLYLYLQLPSGPGSGDKR